VNISIENAKIFVEIGAGELIDKITILLIKLKHISDASKLLNITHELETLQPARQRLVDLYPGVKVLESELQLVNEALWTIEDDIRACEGAKNFGPLFIELARSVYIHNDKRAELKKKINLLCNASIIEEKSYQS